MRHYHNSGQQIQGAVSPDQRWDAQGAVAGLRINPYEVPPPEESGHHVMFGTIDGVGDVAVKPHRTRGGADNEARRITQVKDLGFDVTPFHLVAQGKIAAYLLTRRVPGLTTLGRLGWNRTIADPYVHGGLVPWLADAARFTGEVHERGVIVGDNKLKNRPVVLGESGLPDGTHRHLLMDLEKTQIGVTGDMGAALRVGDLSELAASALCRGFLEDRSPAFRAGFVLGAIIPAHAETCKTRPIDYQALEKIVGHVARTGKLIPVSRAVK